MEYYTRTSSVIDDLLLLSLTCKTTVLQCLPVSFPASHRGRLGLSQATLCLICGRRSGKMTDFSPNTVSPFDHHSTKVSYPAISRRRSINLAKGSVINPLDPEFYI
jgi:hypothetical protein